MKKIFLIGIAATAILASCSNDETVEMSSAKTKAISFTNAFVNNGTRSIVDPSLTKETLGSFAVYGFTQKGQIFDGTVVSSSNKGETWTYNPPQYWVQGNKYAFGAIAPADITVTGEKLLEGQGVADYKVGMTVTFTNDGKTDLLHAAPEKGYDATPDFMDEPETVNMTFNHQLSKVKFSFENNVGEVYNIKVSEVKITNAMKQGTLTVGEEDNVWSEISDPTLSLDFGAAGTTDMTTADAIEYTKEGETYNEKLMIPTKNTQSYTVTFKVELLNGTVPMGEYEHEATISNVELKSGYCYDFKATLNNENIVVDPENPDAQLKPIKFEVATVNGWTPDGENQNLPISDSQSGN